MASDGISVSSMAAAAAGASAATGRSSAKVMPANTGVVADTSIRLAPPTQLLVGKGGDEVKAEALAIPHHYFAELKCDDVLRHFAVTPQGLTDTEAIERKAIYGANQLEKDPPDPWWRMLLEQFSDLLVLMLVAAAIMSMALEHFAEGAVIIVIVVLNATLGVYQESRAGAALEALESLASPQVIVRRAGREFKIDSTELVPGDIVVLESGAKVSADIRLLRSEGLSANEMALTGESEAVHKNAAFVAQPSKDTAKSEEERKAELQARVELKKDKMKAADKRTGADNDDDDNDDDDDIVDDADNTNGDPAPAAVDNNDVNGVTATPVVATSPDGKDEKNEKAKDEKEEEALTDANCVYLGCAIVEGTGEGVVIKTGMSTKMGEIALLLKEADEELSPLHKKLHGLGVRLGLISIFCSVLVFIIGVTTGRGADPDDKSSPVWLQMLLVSVSLTVAAVPEGLPSCVTITLAVGMRNMVRKNALIRNLHSVETLGSATVICTDKTGTLTAGAMTAVQLWFSWTAHKISGEGYNPNGYVTPLSTDETNQAAMVECHERIKTGAQMLPILVGLLCSNRVTVELKEGKTWEASGNMSERPLVIAAKKVGLEQDVINNRYPRAKANQFNSARKMMSTLVSTNDALPILNGAWIACVKGAPNMVLEKCISIAELGGATNSSISIRSLTQDDRDRIMAQVDAYSDEAYRVLAVAYCQYAGRPGMDGPDELECNLIFAGLFAIWDPPRREVEEAILKAAHAGIRTVMITGDYVKTAKAIGEKIKLLPKGAPASKAVDCQIVRTLGAQLDSIKKELKSAKKSSRPAIIARRTEVQRELDNITREADVFARAKPADKITIVRSLQRQGEICSMTGDGVNDAPALKQANIGVAMGLTGTDVAKAASDMVLTDDNFRSIVEAIECGRTIYSNITKFVFYLLSTNSAEVLTILIAVIIGLRSPLASIQILWLNLVTDGAPAIALALEPIEPNIMLQGPRRSSEPLIEKVMAWGILTQTITLTGVCLGVYIIGLFWRTGVWDGRPDGLYLDNDGVSLASFCTPVMNGTAVITPAPNCCGINTCISRSDLLIETQAAQTMVMYVIVFAELLRAYTSRAMRDSLFSLGVWTNQWMQWGVLTAVALTLFVGHVPGIRSVFSMQYLHAREWGVVLALAVIPAILDELQKVCYRVTKFGERPRVKLFTDDATTTTTTTAPLVRPKGRTPADTTQMVTVAAASNGNGHKMEVKSK